jgi:hypothetical protein
MEQLEFYHSFYGYSFRLLVRVYQIMKQDKFEKIWILIATWFIVYHFPDYNDDKFWIS